VWCKPSTRPHADHADHPPRRRRQGPPRRLAEATRRSKASLVAEAIRFFVETNEWQISETHAALNEADAGEFADDKDVAALAKKWRVDAG
jgi:RHH-type transcriptional regulator, rel operon repressor / antitoxin RelB